MAQKNILLGVTGGVAAYKSAELVRLFRKEGMEVRVVMTKAGEKFVTPLLMGTLSGHPVYSELFDSERENRIGHIDLSRWANVILIAPATANFIAKLAHGLCDDLLSTLCLAKAETTNLIIAPAMNKEMWDAQTTQDNLKLLQKRGVLIFGPATGQQACGEVGMGRMLEQSELLTMLKETFSSNILSGRKVLVTAGPTREYIDPVRYISNDSSGKMGYALAGAAVEAGASVTLITGPTHLEAPHNVNIVNVVHGEEMFKEVMSKVKNCDIFISVAAVTDYHSKTVATQKIKKTEKEMNISLKINPDILASVAALHSPPFTVGFAAETENLIKNASQKLKQKNIDMIIANEVGPNPGFNQDTNCVFVFRKDKKEVVKISDHKPAIAKKLIQIIAEASI